MRNLHLIMCLWERKDRAIGWRWPEGGQTGPDTNNMVEEWLRNRTGIPKHLVCQRGNTVIPSLLTQNNHPMNIMFEKDGVEQGFINKTCFSPELMSLYPEKLNAVVLFYFNDGFIQILSFSLLNKMSANHYNTKRVTCWIPLMSLQQLIQRFCWNN